MTASTSPETIRTALHHVPPDLPRDEWARIGMALKASDLSDADAFGLFDEWSQAGETYKAAAVRETWRSIKPGGGITLGTLFHEAKARGFDLAAHLAKSGVQTPVPPATSEEIKARRQARRERETREREERDAAQHAAAEEAARLWAMASETGASPYLERKGLCALGVPGVRFGADGWLIVPMVDAAGELHNLQRIAPRKPAEGPDKLFLKGGRKTGLLHWLGDPAGADVLLIGEGVATCASVHHATGRPVAAAWDAGNLAHVARAVRKAHPRALIVLVADNDATTHAHSGRNPGTDKASEAAQAVRGVAVWPQLEALPEGGTDWNDVHTHAGIDAVRGPIETTIANAQEARRRRERPEPKGQATPEGEDAPTAPGSGGRDLFKVDEAGVWRIKRDEREADGITWRWVCGPLRVVAKGRDVHGNGWCLVLEFNTPDTQARRWLMPLAMLAGDGVEVRRELLGMGFNVPTGSEGRRWLTEYLQSRIASQLVRIVDRVGWHGRAYVLPRETLGDDGGEPILFQSDIPQEDQFKQRGDLAQWQDRIGSLCVSNTRLAFAVSCAFAAPLLAWAGGMDGGGVHFFGNSSSGKTTALRVAASVFGGRDYLQRWRASDNGLEAQAAQSNDALLCLDEIGQLDPKVAGDSAYLLSNGSGKIRANRTGGARPRLQWRVLFLSAGEVGLAEHMSEAGKRAKAGQELRMVDIPADAGVGRGVFEELHTFEGGGELAQHLARACEHTHGTVGRQWLELLVTRTDGLAKALRERIDRIEGGLVPELAAGQVRRVGRRFALIAAAGEMATEAGLTGWPQGEATRGAVACFNAWIESRGGIGASEDAAVLRQVRYWFGLHGEARFTDWNRADDDHAPKTMNRAGWRKAVKGMGDDLVSWEWFVLPDVFKLEACKGYNHTAALALLKLGGHLIPGTGGRYDRRESPPGADKCSVYRIKSSVLSASDDD